MAYLGIKNYWDKTPREIYREVKGVSKRIEDKKKRELEQTRFMMWASLLPHRDPKKGPLKLEDILKLPGDEQEYIPLTSDELQRSKNMERVPLFGKTFE